MQVLGAPLAAGVLHLDGRLGLAGWQWLFLLEGIPTLLLGISFPFVLPRSPAKARWLSADAAAALEAHVAMCRGNSNDLAAASITAMLSTAFRSGPMYTLGVVKFTKDLAAYGLLFWAPVLIRSLLRRHGSGEDGCEAWEFEAEGRAATGYVEVLLTGIPYTVAATMNIVFAWHSQVRPRVLSPSQTRVWPGPRLASVLASLLPGGMSAAARFAMARGCCARRQPSSAPRRRGALVLHGRRPHLRACGAANG